MKMIITLYIIVFASQLGYSQQLVQNISDFYRLKENEAIFINKPLKDLLKEIRPEIKIVIPYNDPPVFDFRFITSEQLSKDENSPENIALFIYVKDIIHWKWENRPKDKETNWTKEDVEKYGDMIVTRISIVY